MTLTATQKARRKAAREAAAFLPPKHHPELEHKLNHTFADPTLLQEALQTKGNGITQIGDRKVGEGNKRLALLGDSVLSLALLRDWYGEGERRQSGHEILVAVSNNRNLNQRGQAIGLSAFINRPKSFANRCVPPRMMSDTVEALIGAVFVDSGESLEAVKVAIRGLGLV